MAHFARLDDGNRVIRVHCLDNKSMTDAEGNESPQMGIDYLIELHGEGPWVQTSYNTRRGEHKLGGTPLRANYCSRGWVYSEEHDIFHPPQPYPSWTLDTVKGEWKPPVPRPEVEMDEDGRPLNFWMWNEDSQQWDKINVTQ